MPIYKDLNDAKNYPNLQTFLFINWQFLSLKNRVESNFHFLIGQFGIGNAGNEKKPLSPSTESSKFTRSVAYAVLAEAKTIAGHEEKYL